ncbi:MAG: ABC transporter substrate-binding protein [Bacteroidota bacterium]
MKQRNTQPVLLLSLIWFSLGVNVLCAQIGRSQLPMDSVALNYVDQGKYYLEVGNPELALDAFKAAYNRPAHQLSSTALYLWGLSAYQENNMLEAELIFNEFLSQYPKSNYLENCEYHLSRIQLTSWEDTTSLIAFEKLMDIREHSKNTFLQNDAQTALQHYMFYETDVQRLEYIIQRIPDQEKLFVLDALAYQHFQNEDKGEARKMYNFFRRKYNYVSPFIEEMLRKPTKIKYVDPGIFKVAVVIPADWDQVWLDSTKIPRAKVLPLDYVEGLKLGIEQYIRVDSNKVYVEVLDSRRDSMTTEQVINRLDVLKPDLVLGDIFNKQSRMIGEWAEESLTAQMVPLSPSVSLAVNKSQVFVAHPSAREHGMNMSVFARHMKHLNKVAVFRDGNNATEQLAYAFTENFKTLGGTVVDVKIPAGYDKTIAKKIVKEVKKLKRAGIDGVYIPIQGNQESAGLILSQMKALNMKAQAMGGPHWWNRYNTIDRELKDGYKLLCSTSYYVDEMEPEYQNFYRQYLKNYQYPPSNYAVQGYDMGLYLMEIIEQYPHQEGTTLANFIKNHAPFYGLHLNLDFRGGQVNQSVNILQYSEDGIECLNCVEKLAIQPLFQFND